VSRQVSFAVPGDLATPTGGYAYARRVISELRELGWTVDVIDIGDGYPRPTPAQCATGHLRLAASGIAKPLVIDGLAYGVMPKGAAVLAKTRPLIALVHHPLALESGVSASEAEALRTSERNALAVASRVIVTSGFSAHVLAADYNVAPQRIVVAEPGTDRAVLAEGSGSDTLNILAVGAIVPRKGYDVLLVALATLADLPWRMTIVGDMMRSRGTVDALKLAIEDAGLADRVVLTGAISDAALAEAYHRADLFVHPSRLEGYGMAATEAIAYGLPIVATRGGALAETLRGAALVVAPDDVLALAEALREVIADRAVRAALRDASRQAAQTLPTWRTTAERFAQAIEAAA
jgi:glycosyltransferase involved in cell wall biosynthesis